MTRRRMIAALSVLAAALPALSEDAAAAKCRLHVEGMT